jgi:hypothetical protein
MRSGRSFVGNTSQAMGLEGDEIFPIAHHRCPSKSNGSALFSLHERARQSRFRSV